MIGKFPLWLFGAALLASSGAAAQSLRDRAPEDEVIYFLLPDRFENGDRGNDRGGITGDRLATGFDPTHKGFFHGGDLKGLTRRLGYIQRLGATAVWLAPVFKNKPVQGPRGQESAGYHGYWVTDFTQVDPHFGSNADFKAFVDAAHARGMKVYMDIITNHTADVIQTTECVQIGQCAYRSIADYPYQRRGGVNGPPINSGFAGHGEGTAANFSRLTDTNYAYTVRVPDAEKSVKVPAWLNDPIHYHNRGDSTFRGESSLMGDFVGLDDLFTESPQVVAGMIEIYGSWIDRFGIDGFRIDTARHVNPEFWQQFVPAMIERARRRGIPNFHMFGEVANDDFNQGYLALHTKRDKLPTVLDFAFKEGALRTIAGNKPTEIWRQFFAEDLLYEGGEATALRLPTFIGNHDMGRFAHHVRKGFPQASSDEVLKRVMLGHVLMLTARGVPTIYSGDEQGFVGDGGDQDAREDMFPSRVAIYNDNDLLGTRGTTAQSNFNPGHPLYRLIAQLADIRRRTPALRHGATVFRAGADTPGLLAFSRVLDGKEVLVALNTSPQPIAGNIIVEVGSTRFASLAGACPAAASAPGSIRITLPPLGYAICNAR
ncbi:alpha-amylase family glycosyl hydrolase [Sphingomonas sp.]|uniref:alpha-amylase family glycosyl hydrolase n=1 Tax=Sphingomonas sp. TaxID=28214 RepID=UPI0017EAA511|nr:alpha-amylase family glycosyl hydrolase [Sphingomonas sp.]MBA3512212.1 alpha-amylase [Sphingomonas sp.]